MKKIGSLNHIGLLLFLGATGLFAQGWTDLPNTHLQNVCPPDGFTATYGGHTMPSASPNGAMYSQCYRVITGWGSGAVDTKRNRLLFMGDGDQGQNDNAVYSVDLQTLSASTATCGGKPCVTTSNNGSVPAVTRLNDPSVFVYANGTDCGTAGLSPNPDGAPRAMQPYASLLYLPHSDTMFMSGQGNSCAQPAENGTWILNLSTMAWAQKSAAPDSAGSGRQCVVDSTVADDEVVCFTTNTSMYRYVVSKDTWTRITGFSGSLTVGNGGTPVLDPMRKLIYVFGATYTGSGPKIYSVSLDGTQFVDLTASSSGCGDLINYAYPSVVYDPSLERIVGYVPQVVSSRPAASNEIVLYEPANNTCVVQPQLGGSGPAADFRQLCSNGGCQGTMGHFNYVPGLGEYVLINNEALDVYTFKLNANATHGLGNSTLTCVDRDGDGYGTGPGCLGPDADDLDASVHTEAQAVAKWGSLALFLNHLGYNPANIWYVSTTGYDKTGVVNNPSMPFAACCGSGHANPAAGDAVVMRGGNYSFFASPAPTGNAGAPIIFMSYPGELPVFTAMPSGIDLRANQTNIVLDGIKFSTSGSNACLGGAGNHYLVMRHLESTGCEWGLDFGGDLPPQQPMYDITVSDTVTHDSASCANGGQHGIYFAEHGQTTAKNIFFYRDISYNNCYTGFQWNGSFSNAIESQDITYNNLTSGYSWTEGVSNSYLLDSVSINDAKGLSMFLYNGNDGTNSCGSGNPPSSLCTCGTPSYALICPQPQSNNAVTNFTAYLTGFDATGSGSCSGGNNACAPAVQVARESGGNCTTSACTSTHMDGNTFTNVIAKVSNADGNSTAGSYAAFQFPDNTGVTFLPTTKFANIDVQDTANAGVVANYGPGSGFGYAPLTCSGLASVAASSTNCQTGDPLFVSTCAYNTIGACNLKLQAASPALNTGAALPAPAYDIMGSAFPNSPSIGAFQYTGPPPPPSCDVNRDGVINSLDVTAAINQALGVAPCGTADLQQNGQCNVVDVQRVINAVMGGACQIGQ
jgi:hypothetical protein